MAAPSRPRPRRACGDANAKVVIPALERRLATRLWLLRLIHSAEDEEAKRIDAVFEVELLDSAWEAPAHGRWAGRAELAGLRLSDEAQRPVLDRYLDALERGDVPQQRPPWARPGWLARRAGLDRGARLARLGRAVVAIEQVKHWSISAVLRVDDRRPGSSTSRSRRGCRTSSTRRR